MAKKKTAKELSEDLNKTVKELEEPTPEPTPPPAPEEPDVEENPEPSPEPNPEPAPSPEPSPQPAEPPQPDEDEEYKKKYVDSKREAMVLHSKNKKIFNAIETATSMPEPTEEELRAKYSDWDVMSPTEQALAKDNMKNQRALSLLAGVAQESKDIEEWNKKVDTFVGDPKTLINYPLLEGKQDDFRIFASKPTRLGVPFEDLVGSFLFEVSKKKPVKKGPMFPTGTPGPSAPQKPKSDKISLDQAMVLKKTNYKKYKEYLLAGKIDQSELE